MQVPVILRLVRHSKYEPLILLTNCANVRLPDGRETTVSLRHLAPLEIHLIENDCEEDTRFSLFQDP